LDHLRLEFLVSCFAVNVGVDAPAGGQRFAQPRFAIKAQAAADTHPRVQRQILR